MKEDAIPERPWTVMTGNFLLRVGVLGLPIFTIWSVRPEGLWPEGRVLSPREFHLLFFVLWIITLGIVTEMARKGEMGLGSFF